MFNEIQKQEFLNYYKDIKQGKQSMISRAEKVLQRIAKYEEEWEKDICFQDDEAEIQKVVNDVGFITSGSTSGQLLALRDYCRWCLENVPNASDRVLKIKKATDDKFRNLMFGNPLQLQIHLNKLFQPESELTVHNVYRAFAWLAFMGFTESQTFSITTDEVDLESMTISHDDMVVKIYQEAAACIENCKNLSYFNFTNINYHNPTIQRSRVEGNLLIRGIKKNPGKHINSEFSRFQTKALKSGQVDRQVTYNNIMQSGIFFRAFQNEQLGIKHNFEAVAIRQWMHFRSQRTDDKEIVYDPTDKVQANRIAAIHQTLDRDYRRWKKVFYNQ